MNLAELPPCPRCAGLPHRKGTVVRVRPPEAVGVAKPGAMLNDGWGANEGAVYCPECGGWVAWIDRADLERHGLLVRPVPAAEVPDPLPEAKASLPEAEPTEAKAEPITPAAQAGAADEPEVEDSQMPITEEQTKKAAEQRKALMEGLPTAAVRKREGPFGKTLSYVDGVWTIEELNRIFGFDAWSYDVVSVHVRQSERVTKKKRDGSVYDVQAAYYEAQVRLKVRFADGTLVVREDVGAGNGEGQSVGEACEKASKEAVTDALKRCARTLGSRFGLSLYDKDNPLHRGGEDSHGDEGDEPPAPTEPPAAKAPPLPAHVKPLADYREHFAKLGAPGVKAYTDTIGRFAPQLGQVKPEQVEDVTRALRAAFAAAHKATAQRAA